MNNVVESPENYKSGEIANMVNVYSSDTVKLHLKDTNAYPPLYVDDNNNYRYYTQDTVVLLYCQKLLVSNPPKLTTSTALKAITSHRNELLKIVNLEDVKGKSLSSINSNIKAAIKTFKRDKGLV